MSDEASRESGEEPAPKPDFASCCEEMAAAMADGGASMARMMSACGPMMQRMLAACGERKDRAGAAEDPAPAEG